jgi:hypothetical protein
VGGAGDLVRSDGYILIGTAGVREGDARIGYVEDMYGSTEE